MAYNHLTASRVTSFAMLVQSAAVNYEVMPRRFPTLFCFTPHCLVCRHCMSPLMEEGFPMGPHVLKSTYRRHKEAHIHILRPVHRMSRSSHEHTLDLKPVLKGSQFEVSHFQADNLNSPTGPQPDLKKHNEHLDFLPTSQEHRHRASHQAPAVNGLSHSLSGECNGPPSWCQSRFELERPPPPGISLSNGNLWSAPYLPPPPRVKDPLRQKRRKSCEYCRFRKRKCSGHDTCIRCFRLGIHCMYMPDLTAKRMADCLRGNPRPSLGSRFSCPTVPIPAAENRSCVGELHHSDTGYPCLPPSILRNNPPKTSHRPSVRGIKRKERVPSGPMKRLPSGNLSIQSVAPDPLEHCPRSPVHVGLEIPLADRAFFMASGDVGFWDAGLRCFGFGALDHHVMSTPTSQSQEVFVDTPRTQSSRYPEADVNSFEFGAFPLDIDPTVTSAARVSGSDTPSSTETGSSEKSPKNLSAPSRSFYSVTLSPSSSAVATNMAGDPTESWTIDDWAQNILPGIEKDFSPNDGTLGSTDL